VAPGAAGTALTLTSRTTRGTLVDCMPVVQAVQKGTELVPHHAVPKEHHAPARQEGEEGTRARTRRGAGGS
jgi:hypothetical protein